MYIPLPGPPALKDPPPPIIKFNTHEGTKSSVLIRGIDSRPIITCDKTAKPDGPGNAGISQSSYKITIMSTMIIENNIFYYLCCHSLIIYSILLFMYL